MKLILPPPTLLKIIDRTAFYVSQHGKQLETKIKYKYEKFNFLNNNNIFFPYYIYKLKVYLSQQKKNVDNRFNLIKINNINNRLSGIFLKNIIKKV
mmetsp:Transcript_4220/g.8191  ORF Transcript_4220/g.8191 Transcript_4220/m.8191 type:complete len:96 (+) Transcript_4220:207-494(+)